MKKTWLAGCLALGLSVGAFAPVMAHADEVGINMNMNMGADDEAHFHFSGHHDPLILRAAQQLREAKRTLWKARRRGPDKARAIHAINAALDELSNLEMSGR